MVKCLLGRERKSRETEFDTGGNSKNKGGIQVETRKRVEKTRKRSGDVW